MKQILNLLLVGILAACANVEVTKIPVAVETKINPTNTSLPPTPLPSITPAQEILCDPFRADFCVTDGQFILQRPIHPPANDRVDMTYGYGSTSNGTRDPHHGVEFSNASGTPVHVAADGTVIFAGADSEAVYSPWPNYYGNLVVVEHAVKLFTLYAHLSKIEVETGQKVVVGDKLGEVGRSGVAIGSHLHFEVRRGNVEDYFSTQNPELWLIPAKDENNNVSGVLQISVVDPGHRLIKYAEFTIQYHQDKSEYPDQSYYGTSYSSDMLNGDENALFSELPAGRYRIAVNVNGKMYERWVEVESGKLTRVVFVVS